MATDSGLMGDENALRRRLDLGEALKKQAQDYADLEGKRYRESADALRLQTNASDEFYRKLLDQENQYQTLLRQRAALYAPPTQPGALGSGAAPGASGAKEEISYEDRYQALFKNRLTLIEQENSLRLRGRDVQVQGGAGSVPGRNLDGARQVDVGAGGGALGGFKPYAQQAAGQLGLPTSELAAFGMALKLTTDALKSMEDGVSNIGYDKGLATDSFYKRSGLSSLPGAKELTRSQVDMVETTVTGGIWDKAAVGAKFLFGKTDPSEKTYRQREQEQRDAEDRMRRATRAAALTGSRDDTNRNFQRQWLGQQSQLQFGANDNALKFNASTRFTAASEAAQAAAGKTLGYGRAEEQADILRRSSFGESLAVAGGQAARNIGGLTKQRDFDKGVVADLEQKAALQRRQVATQADRANKFEGKPDNEQAANARMDLEGGQAKLIELERQLQEARTKGLQSEQSVIDATNQAGQQRNQLLMSERNSLTAIIQSERARTQSMKENFGIMLPGQKAAAVEVAQKMHDNKQLTREEFEFAKGHQDIFGDQLKKMGAANAGPEWQKIMDLTGRKEREQQSEKERVQLDSQIKVDVTGVDKNIAEAIMSKMMPQISAVMAQVTQKLKDELDKQNNAQQRGRLGAQN